MSPAFLKEQEEIFAKQAENLGKPANVLQGIIKGKLAKMLSEICLLEQPFVKDDKRKVSKVLEDLSKEVGHEDRDRRLHLHEAGRRIGAVGRGRCRRGAARGHATAAPNVDPEGGSRMTRDKIRSQAEERMKKSIQSLQDEFKTLRGSRASQSLFEKIRVDYYGNKVPLNQVATISIPEARLVIIQPWDRSVLAEIEKAIQKSELSVNPNNDGKVIRINIPPLTEERRKELVKLTKNTAEQSRVSVRNVRRDANEEIKKAKSDSELCEDEAKKATDEIQKLTDKHIEEINKLLEAKEKEILEV